MRGSDSLRYQDMISGHEIETRIAHLAFLDDEEPAALANWPDELEELAALRALPDGVDCLISEGEWGSYASNQADDQYDLTNTGAWAYFNYALYADDLEDSYSQTEFLGFTYFYQEG